MSYIIKILSIFLLNFLLNSTIDAKKCSEKDSDEADLCMSKMLLIGDRTQRFRETVDEMHTYCKKINELQVCVKRFSRDCLPRFARQVTNLLLFGVSKVNKPLCLNDKNKLAFTSVAKCGNINIESKHKCMDQFIVDLKGTEAENGNNKIPFVCCYVWKFKDCVKQTFDSIDAKRCPKKSIEGVLNLISGYTGDALDLICSEFDDGSEKCKTLLINKSTNTANTSNTTVTKSAKRSRKSKSSKSHSILPSFIKIFTSL